MTMATAVVEHLPEHYALHLGEPIYSEDYETMWIPGHIRDRNERRRWIEDRESEHGRFFDFLEACEAARRYEFVYLVCCTRRENCSIEHGEWDELWHRPDPNSGIEETVVPWTRVDLKSKELIESLDDGDVAAAMEQLSVL